MKVYAYIRPNSKISVVEQLRMIGEYMGGTAYQTVFEENRHAVLSVLSFQLAADDILVIPTVEVLSKNPMDQNAVLEKFLKNKVKVIFVKEEFDLANAAGIQYLRDLQNSIPEYKARLANVRGEKGGRKKKYSQEQHKLAWELRQQGLSMDEISQRMGLSPDQARYLWQNYKPIDKAG